MNQLGLFEVAPPPPSNPYAFDSNQIGAAIRPFVRFCREQLSAKEGDGTLATLIEESWKSGRHHPYIKAWDAHNGRAAC